MPVLAPPPAPPALVRTVAAPPCDPAIRARALAPARPGDDAVSLTCSLRLGPGDRVTRRILLEGSRASGVTLDCDGATIGPGPGAGLLAFAVEVRSRPPAGRSGRWDRPEDVTIQNCTILGHVRVWGMGLNGQGEAVRLSSHGPGHTERAQDAAPARVTLRDSTITAFGHIPVYLGPGVTGFTLRDSRLDGRSESTAIYLDAESADNAILDNDIATATGREIVAVDGSARNRITGNRVALGGRDGVHLYRNCGEGGTVRHQTPSDNTVTGNTFRGGGFLGRPVVVNARGGWRLYCGQDAGYPFGSSIDDADNATGNTVEPNRTE
ncbi:right-handed parallel beta-helix repeat-containing protein [Methylobacterium sp. NEAU 140]|uniref:right-handed parallel beta-helix repeat-containing protein n=1 Tax=Methylobacterium sp. NEAU 140 TaxID=3064945 RepID=UPI0027336627|nr:right-handed parallel beta-helix repeat-containing protein [Methylobacterium sp. NEAU 140]MDP4021276.1 right-handed parallel beta-helix repeat-containing protein [Methylobacterium sp. NEAU 140]